MEVTDAIDINLVLKGYIEAALWTSTDDYDVPLDDENYGAGRLTVTARRKMLSDVKAFMENYGGLLYSCSVGERGEKGYAFLPEQIGQDLWLTRNGHGCGFWENDHCMPDQGKVLTEGAKRMGQSYFAVSRGWIYIV